MKSRGSKVYVFWVERQNQKYNQMKKIIITTITLVFVLSGCNKHNAPQEFFDETFHWRIMIPANFRAVNPERWERRREYGLQRMESTFNEKITDDTRLIFNFSNGQTNYIEALYHFVDPEIDGDFSESRKLLEEIMYTAFVAQMPTATVRTSTTTERIDNLDFYVLEIRITFPNNMIFNTLMYSRLFGSKVLGVNIMYQDAEIREKMLDAWRNSTFGKIE